MVEAIVAASPGPSVLDVGCGTGIAARHFQAVGCRVLGVDPGADCRPGAAVRGRGRGGEGTGPTPGMSGWNVVPTFGGYSQFPPAQQQDLLAGIGAAIDAVGGSFRMVTSR